MKFRLEKGLPFVVAMLTFRGQRLTLGNVLLDTGSSGTVFSTDRVLEIGLKFERNDMLHRVRGVGGTEYVFTKQIEQLTVGELVMESFEIEIGALDYGFVMDGIIGTDFLSQTGAVIDFVQLEVRRATG